ncbi:MAG: hypothetical protein RLN70_01145, partial [Rhodospirillaceae bacterium]
TARRRSMNTATKREIERALENPGDVFNEPEEVLEYPGLDDQQRAAILSRWAYDVREVSVAAEEGMPGGEASRLRRIHIALRKLGVAPDGEQSPPNKQGIV